MNNQIRTVLKKRYEAEIADAKYKIKCYSEHELVIPEHPDITAGIGCDCTGVYSTCWCQKDHETRERSQQRCSGDSGRQFRPADQH